MGAGLLNTSRDGTFSLYSNMEDGAILALRQVFIPAVLGPVLQKFVSPRFGRKTGLTSYDRFINS